MYNQTIQDYFILFIVFLYFVDNLVWIEINVFFHIYDTFLSLKKLSNYLVLKNVYLLISFKTIWKIILQTFPKKYHEDIWQSSMKWFNGKWLIESVFHIVIISFLGLWNIYQLSQNLKPTDAWNKSWHSQLV